MKEVVYLLHSLSAARLSLPGSPLGVRWETAAFGLPLVGSWLVENTDADSWFENTVRSASCTYHVANVLHFNLLRKFICANQLIARS